MKAFSTERLQLRWPLDTVYPDHVHWLNDKTLMRWSEQRHLEHTYDTQRQYIFRALQEKNPIVFDIKLRGVAAADGFGPLEMGMVSIGTVAAYLDRRNRRADMGILLGPQFHHHGYGIEVWKGAMQVLQNEFNVQKFEAGCAAGNLPIQRLLSRCGFEFEGNRGDHFIIDGKPHDMLMFGGGPL